MYEIPIFPLNTVLFPGMPLQLHIFEERYKLMINTCIKTSSPFGVVLIKEGLEALGPLAQPHMVGCTARIATIEKQTDGRMNIATIGDQRFNIRGIDKNQPYLIATVEDYPLPIDKPELTKDALARLRPLVNKYLETLSTLGDLNVKLNELPEDPKEFGYLSAFIAQTSMKEKQNLLESENSEEFLGNLTKLFRKELPLLRVISKANPEENGISFSNN